MARRQDPHVPVSPELTGSDRIARSNSLVEIGGPDGAPGSTTPSGRGLDGVPCSGRELTQDSRLRNGGIARETRTWRQTHSGTASTGGRGWISAATRVAGGRTPAPGDATQAPQKLSSTSRVRELHTRARRYKRAHLIISDGGLGVSSRKPTVPTAIFTKIDATTNPPSSKQLVRTFVVVLATARNSRAWTQSRKSARKVSQSTWKINKIVGQIPHQQIDKTLGRSYTYVEKSKCFNLSECRHEISKHSHLLTQK